MTTTLFCAGQQEESFSISNCVECNYFTLRCTDKGRRVSCRKNNSYAQKKKFQLAYNEWYLVDCVGLSLTKSIIKLEMPPSKNNQRG